MIEVFKLVKDFVNILTEIFFQEALGNRNVGSIVRNCKRVCLYLIGLFINFHLAKVINHWKHWNSMLLIVSKTLSVILKVI